MISYLRGSIKAEKTGFIILEVSGVGYKVYANVTPLRQGSAGQEDQIELYIYENIREDTDDLYGFGTFEELELFEKLISVNGVGPKAGMLIMACASPERIIASIISEDLGFFTAISGIGKKVAAKIILELKSKISGMDGSGVIGQTDSGDEVVEALLSLGYKRAEIMQMSLKIPAEITDSEGKIRWLLKNLSK